jgi:sporulation protein YlmC with PRC-barrel domain
MRTKLLAASLLAATLLSPAAFAQSTTTPAKDSKAEVTVPAPHWRSSKLIGVNIYNDQNEKLGDINEILLDPNGKVIGYVIGVGGFLGMGEHDIMVEPSKIKFVNEPARTASTTTTTTTTTATNTNATPSTTTAPTNTKNVSATTRAPGDIWYPDHGVLSATKDQLKAMPQFKYTAAK